MVVVVFRQGYREQILSGGGVEGAVEGDRVVTSPRYHP